MEKTAGAFLGLAGVMLLWWAMLGMVAIYLLIIPWCLFLCWLPVGFFDWIVSHFAGEEERMRAYLWVGPLVASSLFIFRPPALASYPGLPSSHAFVVATATWGPVAVGFWFVWTSWRLYQKRKQEEERIAYSKLPPKYVDGR